MSNKICEKCGQEIPQNAKVCTHCGYRSKATENSEKSKDDKNINNNSSFSLIIIVVAIIGVITIFSYRAWLGGILYLLAGIFAISLLRQTYEKDNTKSAEEFIKNCFTGKNTLNRLLIIISFLMPIIEIIATYRWIVNDTISEVESML